MLATRGDIMRLLVVDDSATFRSRVSRHLADDPSIEVVAEVDNGADALREIEHLRPDVVLLDLFMPPPDGFTVLRTVKGRFAVTKVVVLTSDASATIRERCEALRADAVIDKAHAAALLIPTLRRFAMARSNEGTS